MYALILCSKHFIFFCLNMLVHVWNPVGIRAVKVLANHLANPGSPETAQMQIQEWIAESDNATLALISAVLHTMDDNTKEAIKSLRNARTMEHHALLVQVISVQVYVATLVCHQKSCQLRS